MPAGGHQAVAQGAHTLEERPETHTLKLSAVGMHRCVCVCVCVCVWYAHSPLSSCELTVTTPAPTPHQQEHMQEVHRLVLPSPVP